ncbi:hypothetical protein KVR01_003539 [Diaporthe batatas]|uniref:uncharacterized protein n=1 Tax=Diaporthe batatas TaxID=748121 RepID=UPI001D04EBD6|nr:uncharacterized protein KVR01_003539 [Diaporthe batatas]KAG8167850.1 hypothetical protein KVR01_003539 [Diaporthe batatas]
MWHVGTMPIVDECHDLVVNAILWTALAFIAVGLRLFTRGLIVKRTGWDDYLMAAAMVSCSSTVVVIHVSQSPSPFLISGMTEVSKVCSIGFLVAVMYQIRWGLGQAVNPANLESFLTALFVTVPFYNCTQTFYKLSLTTQAARLFTTTTAARIMRAAIVWVCACGLMSFCAALFYCFPVSKAWDDSIPGWCVNRPALNYSVAGFNILNDIMLLIIPLPFLTKLQLPRKQRIILISVFACGLFTTVVSIVRLRALYQNLNGPYEEQSVTSVPIALWSVIEINVAIICGSVPSLKAFVSRVIFGTKPGSTPSHGVYGLSATRKQSQVLRSQAEEDERRGTRLEIQVQQSIEMKAYVDETGSDKDLIQAGTQGYRNDSRNMTVTKINANTNTVSVSGSSSPV